MLGSRGMATYRMKTALCLPRNLYNRRTKVGEQMNQPQKAGILSLGSMDQQ